MGYDECEDCKETTMGRSSDNICSECHSAICPECRSSHECNSGVWISNSEKDASEVDKLVLKFNRELTKALEKEKKELSDQVSTLSGLVFSLKSEKEKHLDHVKITEEKVCETVVYSVIRRLTYEGHEYDSVSAVFTVKEFAITYARLMKTQIRKDNREKTTETYDILTYTLNNPNKIIQNRRVLFD